MSKRHLTDQQKRRIAARQDHFAMAKTEDERPGLVIAQQGKSLEVETESGDIILCHARQNLGSLVAGDRIMWCQVQADNVIVAKQERRSVLSRPDVYKQEKIIAANIDQMVIVLSVQPEPIWHFLDKYLVAAELQGFAVFIVLNKWDLADAKQQAQLQQALSIYQQLGYACLPVSCENQAGLTELKAALASKTSIFVGQSGVGKSSLTNALFNQDLAIVGDMSEANKKGQHTTTTARLYHFPAGGDLIDSPGIREFGLWHISPEQVLRGFKEIYQHAGNCKFRDCRHQNTKGCAVQAAVSQGLIDSQRLSSYFRVLENLD